MFSTQSSDAPVPLHTADGTPLGVFIPQALWEKLKDEMAACLERLCPSERPCRPEPMEDWNMLKTYWDFRYPVSAEVVCDVCGAQSTDWENDAPRKFLLKAANLGGLARFECQACKAMITKRHFKDHMEFSCIPCDEL